MCHRQASPRQAPRQHGAAATPAPAAAAPLRPQPPCRSEPAGRDAVRRTAARVGRAGARPRDHLPARPDVWDGRFANNGWLQELPKPLTKLTWDNAAWMHPALASQHKLRDGDVIELRYKGRTARMPIFRVGGHPRESVTVFLGYGRRMAGRVGNATGIAEGFNPFLLRTSDAPWFGTGLEIAKTGERYLLATHAGSPPDGRARPGPGGRRSRSTCASRRSSPRWARSRHGR